METLILIVAAVLGALGVTAVAAWLWQRDLSSPSRPDFMAGPHGPPAEEDQTEEDLYRFLRRAGVDVTPEEIAEWGSQDYLEAWAYVRTMADPESAFPPPIPQCLRRRRWRATS